MLYVDGNVSSISGPGAGSGRDSERRSDHRHRGQQYHGNWRLFCIRPSRSPPHKIKSLQGAIRHAAITRQPTRSFPQIITGQVLGIFTAGGNVNLSEHRPDGMLEIDASLATIRFRRRFRVESSIRAAPINKANDRRRTHRETRFKISTATTRNVWFDRRFSQGGFAPPWFPATTVTPSATDSVTSVTTTIQRTQWLDLY